MDDLKFWKYISFVQIIIIFLLLFIFYYITYAFNEISLYRSETKAFNVSQNLRCDFYIEYQYLEIINITLTDCIKI
jgi:hypothetical protein